MSLLTKLTSRFGTRRTPKERSAVKRRREQEPATVQPRSFEAVAIGVRERACKEARQLANTRFLVAEAPKLPLPSCGLRCTCTYKTYPDRREEPRRGIDVGISGTYYLGPDRRHQRDRRLGDRSGADRNYYDFMRSGTRIAPPRGELRIKTSRVQRTARGQR